jgi:hypothetical protein
MVGLPFGRHTATSGPSGTASELRTWFTSNTPTSSDKAWKANKTPTIGARQLSQYQDGFGDHGPPSTLPEQPHAGTSAMKRHQLPLVTYQREWTGAPRGDRAIISKELIGSSRIVKRLRFGRRCTEQISPLRLLNGVLKRVPCSRSSPPE